MKIFWLSWTWDLGAACSFWNLFYLLPHSLTLFWHCGKNGKYAWFILYCLHLISDQLHFLEWCKSGGLWNRGSIIFRMKIKEKLVIYIMDVVKKYIFHLVSDNSFKSHSKKKTKRKKKPLLNLHLIFCLLKKCVMEFSF